MYMTVEGLQQTSEFMLTVDDGDVTKQTETTSKPTFVANGSGLVVATTGYLALILLNVVCATTLIVVH